MYYSDKHLAQLATLVSAIGYHALGVGRILRRSLRRRPFSWVCACVCALIYRRPSDVRKEKFQGTTDPPPIRVRSEGQKPPPSSTYGQLNSVCTSFTTSFYRIDATNTVNKSTT